MALITLMVSWRFRTIDHLVALQSSCVCPVVAKIYRKINYLNQLVALQWRRREQEEPRGSNPKGKKENGRTGAYRN